MKRILKVLLVVLSMCIITLENTEKAYAASGSVSMSVSSSSVAIGSKITVTITVKCGNGIGGTTMYLSYNSSYLTLSSHNAGDNFNKNNGKLLFEATSSSSKSYRFTFTTKKVGSTSIALQTNEFIDYNDGHSVTGYSKSISKKVSIVEKTTRNTTTTVTLSADASLSKINVENFTLEPAFASDVTEYKVYLPKGTTSLPVSATPSSSKASVGAINSQLNPGWNTINIVCTAENKGTKTYVIKAYVEEEPDIFYTLDEKQYGVVKNLDKLVVDESFSKQDLEVGEKTLTVFNKDAYQLIYLENESQEKNFYVYNSQENQIVDLYQPIIIGNKTFLITRYNDTDFEYLEENFVKEKITIDDITIEGWGYKAEDMKDFKLLYLSNQQAEKLLYRYDTVEKTIQRYVEPEEVIDYKPYLYLSGSIAGAYTLLLSIILIAKKDRVSI